MDLDYIRKINGTFGKTSRETILDEMVEQYNYADNNVITEFDVLINTKKAKDVFINDTPSKVLIEYKNDKNNRDSKFFIQVKSYPKTIKAGDILSYVANDETGELEYYISTSKPMQNRGYDVNYVRYCNQIINLGNGLFVPALVEGESYGVKIFQGNNEFISDIDTKVKVQVQKNELTESVKVGTRIMFSHSKHGIYKIGDVSVYQEGILVYTCKKDRYMEGYDDIENNLAYNETGNISSDIYIRGKDEIRKGRQESFAISEDVNGYFMISDEDILKINVVSSDEKQITIVGNTPSEVITLDYVVDEVTVCSKTILCTI